MTRRRWLPHIVFKALAHRKGRTALLLAVLTMASSLATALGIVSSSMGKRVAEETRKYGANLVVVPETARMEVGSGGLRFGAISEPAFLDSSEVSAALARSGVRGERSWHLKSALRLREVEILCEGVDFGQVRKMFPWWQLKGGFPGTGGAVVGSDLAARFGLKVGDSVELAGGGEPLRVTISGMVTTGGEEDAIFFLDLARLQQYLKRPGQVSQVRLLVDTAQLGLKQRAAALQPFLPGALVKEMRQVGRTSEELLAKVQLLMLLVTAVVLVCAGSSVAGTMGSTVLERGKEIGLMKAMGGTRWDLLRIYAAESLLLGCAGGVSGYLFGSLIAQFVARTVFSAPAGLVPGFFLVSLGVSLLLALAGSLGPLLSVFRLDPVRSLRGE